MPWLRFGFSQRSRGTQTTDQKKREIKTIKRAQQKKCWKIVEHKREDEREKREEEVNAGAVSGKCCHHPHPNALFDKAQSPWWARQREMQREKESKQDYNQSCILCGLFVVLMPFLLLPLLLLHIYATNPRFFFFRLHYGYCLAVPCCSLTHTQKHTQTHTWEVKFAAFWSLRSFACTLLCRFPFSCLFAKWIFLLLFMFRLHLNTISEYPAHVFMEYISGLGDKTRIFLVINPAFLHCWLSARTSFYLYLHCLHFLLCYAQCCKSRCALLKRNILKNPKQYFL